ncbi:2-acylglycerol O-acyltransferase 2-B-like [Python bivittatus]|uniref:Acyltransferase n=1 Tax=Python bivittatus TaxID=176946 RepID=A0A9F2WGY4_PYTBI|nr:2-acylglycerol O-acyltransferase 2-B-like [Python bivittatus]
MGAGGCVQGKGPGRLVRLHLGSREKPPKAEREKGRRHRPPFLGRETPETAAAAAELRRVPGLALGSAIRAKLEVARRSAARLDPFPLGLGRLPGEEQRAPPFPTPPRCRSPDSSSAPLRSRRRKRAHPEQRSRASPRPRLAARAAGAGPRGGGACPSVISCASGRRQPCCVALYLLLLLGEGWLLAFGCAAWLCLDWETPCRGGRRSAWVRGWGVWRCFRDYFPITLVKTSELDPSRNYLFGFHPHGVLVAGAFGNFCTEATGFSQLFPGLTPHLLMLPFWFKVPFFRDYIMSGGLVSSEKASVSYLLGREGGGQVAVIAVGGPPESLDARPGALTLQLRSRKGFIKMALQHGASLVPVFSFGENELFNQVSNPQGSFIRTLQERLQKIMGLALPLFHARGVFQYNFGLLPFRRPIYTVVGAPILVPRTPHPSPEAIDELHEMYLEKLTRLFEEHKAKYGLPQDKHLTLT